VQHVHARASDEQMQILNLGRDWVSTVLPHVLSKINRVHYGVHTVEELQRALKDNPTMAKSRQLLAVPFVAKVGLAASAPILSRSVGDLVACQGVGRMVSG
jgi:hypothetical protein